MTNEIPKWSDDQWQGAVLHMLACKKQIPECPVCQEIEKHVQQEPNRSILRDFPEEVSDGK